MHQNQSTLSSCSLYFEKHLYKIAAKVRPKTELAPGWLTSYNTGLEVIPANRASLANRASPAHVIRPCVFTYLSPTKRHKGSKRFHLGSRFQKNNLFRDRICLRTLSYNHFGNLEKIRFYQPINEFPISK